MSLLLLFHLLAAEPSASQARPPQIGCRGARLGEVCTDQGRAAALAQLGLRSLEAETTDGVEVYRALYLVGGGGLPAVAFVRRPGRNPEVEISGAGGRRLTAEAPLDVWNDVRSEGAIADRVLEPRNGEADDYCTEGGAVLVEVGLPPYGARTPSVIRRRAESACGSGVTNRFARRLASLAVPLFPGCAAISPGRMPDDGIGRFSACLRLSGDQIAASAAFNRFSSEPRPGASPLEWTEATGVDERTRLSWNGQTVSGDPRSFLIERASTLPNLRLDLIQVEGVSGREAVAQGYAVHGAGSHILYADFTQIWVWSDTTHEWRVREWTVGEFGRPEQ